MIDRDTDIFFEEVDNWKATKTSHENLGYSLYNVNWKYMGMFWPNDDCSIGEVILSEDNGKTVIKTDKFFPYNREGLLQAVRCCYLLKQTPKEGKFRHFMRRVFSRQATKK